jgi:hypothetical protein
VRSLALVLFGLAAVIVSSLSTGVAAPVPKHLVKEPEGDKAKFQGKWKIESILMGGKDILAVLGQNFEMELQFKGEQFTARGNIGGMVQTTTGTVKYGTAESRLMKMMDRKTVGPDGKPVNNAAQKEEAFGYAFDGEKVLLGSTSDGGAKGIDPLNPGPNDFVIVLIRVKEK